MASWAGVVLPVQMAGEPWHATGPLRAPETRGFRPTTRAPVEGPLQVDRRLVRPFLHSQSTVNRCHDQAVRFLVASSLFDPGKPVYEREIAFESRFGVAFPGKRRSLSSLLPPPPFAERASSSGGGLPRGFTTITQGWPDTHRRLAHDSFGDFAVRSAKSGTSE